MSINTLCNLEYLIKPVDWNENDVYDVVTTSLFKMQQGYKNFEKYMNGLELGVTYFGQKLPEIKFMLFIDETIANDSILFDRIKKMNNGKLIVILFHCPKFLNQIDSKNSGHIELFGTMIRFLPFFDYDGNRTRNVICIDSDVVVEDMDQLIFNYNIFQKSKSKYHYDTNMFYEILAKWSLVDDYTILAGRHMCKYKFPLHLLTDYIDCVKNTNCQDMTSIKSFMNFEKYHTFPYGIDEYFLNHILLPYMKNQKINYSTSIRYSITAPLYYLSRQNTIPIDSVEGIYLCRKMNHVMNMHEKYNYKKVIYEFDKTFCPYAYGNERIITEKVKSIAYKYYDFILEMWQNEDYRFFQKQTLKKILNCRDYISKQNIIIYYGSGKTKKYLVPGYLKIQ